MIRGILVLGLLSACPNLHAQNYLGDERKWIKRSMAIADTGYTVTMDSSELRLEVLADGPFPIRSEFYFMEVAGSRDWCDSIVHRFTCGPCFDGSLEGLVMNYGNDWLLMDDGRYVTPEGRYKTRSQGDKESSLALPVLAIKRDPGAPICGTMTFSYLVLPKSKAKEMVKWLRCSGRGVQPDL